MRRNMKMTRYRPASPDDYRRFAEESVRRCLQMPASRKRGRAVQLILARAWDKLADQAEDWRRAHPPSKAA